MKKQTTGEVGSKTGQVTITVLQENGVRFKTLARSVSVQSGSD